MIAFYGVRGIGSVYYLGYAATHVEFIDEAQLWAIVSFTIFASTILHGLTAIEVVRRLVGEAAGSGVIAVRRSASAPQAGAVVPRPWGASGSCGDAGGGVECAAGPVLRPARPWYGEARMQALIEYASYMPHGYCLFWQPWLVTLYAGSDLLIFAAYSLIPFALLTFLPAAQDLRFRGLVALFAAFILLCGITHLISVVTLWVPVYPLHGLAKLITGVVSIVDGDRPLHADPEARRDPEPAPARGGQRTVARGGRCA